MREQEAGDVRPVHIWNFTSQDIDICLRSLCINMLSPQISEILFGNLTWKMTVSAILRNTSITNAQINVEIA